MSALTEAIYTMEEAAARLRISRRTLQELIKDHRFYFSTGRRKLFTEGDIANLIEALREPPCRSSSSRRSRVARPIGMSGGRTTGSYWTEAQRRLSELKQRDGSASGNRTSTVVSFPVEPIQRS